MKINVASRFFAAAIVIVLIAVVLGTSIPNIISVHPQEVPTNLQGDPIAMAAASQTTAVHQQAMNILITVAVFALLAVIVLMMIYAAINRRVRNQIDQREKQNHHYRQN